MRAALVAWGQPEVIGPLGFSEKLMDSPERNGDAQIPGFVVIAYEDVYDAISFVPPNCALAQVPALSVRR